MSKVIFALDVSDSFEAERWVKTLTDHVGSFKIGLELFMSAGPAIVPLVAHYKPVMLDLKLHDIPETVERAVLRAGDLGAKFVTLHVQQKETLRRAVKAAEESGIQLLGVTVLTSMDEQDLDDLRFQNTDAAHRVVHLARMAWGEGVTGFVCSPKEVSRLREALPDAFLVVPGIRPAGAETGDQKRVGTPAEAIRDGANCLVVGRPIRDAADPVRVTQAINEDVRLNLRREVVDFQPERSCPPHQRREDTMMSPLEARSTGPRD